MEQFKLQYANPFYRWPMTFAEIFPVGVIVSLVSAGATLQQPLHAGALGKTHSHECPPSLVAPH